MDTLIQSADGSASRGREYPSRPIPSVHAVVLKGERALVVKRAHPPSQGRWSVPGGAVEVGETIRAAVKRELHEECGIKIQVDRLLNVVDNVIPDETGRVRFHYVLIYLLAHYAGGEARPGSDAGDLRWVTRDDLNELDMHPLARQALHQAFDVAARLGILDDGRKITPEEGIIGPGATVSLREITAQTVVEVCKLHDTLTEPKKSMVTPNALSIAQAHFSQHAWFRAIYADETPVGFIMLYDYPEKQEYFLWRLMIAEPHHGKGFGRRAVELLIDYVKTRPGAQELRTSCAQGQGSPEEFYRALGFERTGEMLGDQVEMRLAL